MDEQSSTAGRAKEQVQEKAQVAGEKVKEAAGTARSRMRDQVDQRSTQAGEQVRSSAQALRTTSEKLREEGQDAPARAAERMADQAERVGGYLQESDADRILRDVEDFGRRQPLTVAAVGLLAGFAASRLLKASSSARYARGNGHAYRSSSEQRVPAALGGGPGGVPSDVDPGITRPSVPAGPGTPGATTPISPETGMPRYGQSGSS
jgi:hypothetical protein